MPPRDARPALHRRTSLRGGLVLGAGSSLVLAGDLPAVWNSPAADMGLKQRIVQILIREIVVEVSSDKREIVLLLHWAGGRHSELRIAKRTFIGGRRRLWLGRGDRCGALDGPGHEVPPDPRWHTAAIHTFQRGVVIIANPHADHKIAGVTNKQCVPAVLRRSRLSVSGDT